MDRSAANAIMNDEYSARILVWCVDQPHTAMEMHEILSIPISACYNRIHELEKAQLLKCVEVHMSQAGKHISLYRSTVSRVTMVMDRGMIKFKFELTNGGCEDIDLLDEAI
jgi:hypothetical protein